MGGIPKRDLTGQKFGKLTALKRAKWHTGNTRWLCACSCGNQVEKFLSSLTRGTATHCGCVARSLKKRPSKAQLIKDLLELKRVRDVAAKHSTGYRTIHRWCKFYRLPTSNLGESHWAAKLTNHDVELIRELVSLGIPAKDVAEKFEVSKMCISNVVNYATYKNVI